MQYFGKKIQKKANIGFYFGGDICYFFYQANI